MFSKKKMKKKCYLRSERIGPVTWHFRVYRISLSFCELDERRDSSFFYSRNAGLQHYRGICLCGNGLLSICVGRVCAGTGFRFFMGPRDTGYGISHYSGDTGYGMRDFVFCTGPRDTGYGISHFARDHGIIPNPVLSLGKNPGEGPGYFRYYVVTPLPFSHLPLFPPRSHDQFVGSSDTTIDVRYS